MTQVLRALGHKLYYYTFPTKSGKHNYRVDFLVAEGDKVSPIDVKSSGYRTHALMDAFCRKFSARVRNKYIIYAGGVRKEQDVL